MKKLNRKSTVHPSPPPPITDLLSFLPASIFTLSLSLTPEDQEILAYLLSSSSGSKQSVNSHNPAFDCDCFSCYTSYWVRWDSSPNRQLIHEIIEAYEDSISCSKNRVRRKRKKKVVDRVSDVGFAKDELGLQESEGIGEEEMVEKSSVKKLVKKLVKSIGERIWSFWG